MQKKFLRSLLSVSCLFEISSYASNAWVVTINNDSDFLYSIKSVRSQCWNVNTLETSESVLSHSSLILNMNENYNFPRCTIGQHYVEIVGTMPEYFGESVMHQFRFFNVLDFRIFPYPTYEKKIYWENYVDNSNHSSEKFSHILTCNTKPTNGDMYLTLTIDNNAYAQVNSTDRFSLPNVQCQ